MKFSFSFLIAAAFFGLAAAEPPTVTQLRDPVTGRKITRYQSPHHETHHYYDISPWSPAGDKLLFFRFDESVDKLSATGRYPGSLWIMDAEGGNPVKVAAGLSGHYHTGVNQFWGPGGDSVYFRDKNGGTAVIDLATKTKKRLDTPVPANRMSPDFQTISCVKASEWGIFDIGKQKYRSLVTLERAIALTPKKKLLKGAGSALQNTRFSPKGDRIVIVHRTLEDFPRLVEMFAYEFATGQLKHLAANLHHPNWRPDGKAVLFVRRRAHDNLQALWEVDVQTGRETRLTDEHVSGVHTSYHPTKPHLVVTDSYGGKFGYGLILVNLKTRELQQLATIPLGAKPAPQADDRFPFRNWGLWFPPRPYLNEPRPAWNHDGSRLLYTSEEGGRMNLYVIDTSDL